MNTHWRLVAAAAAMLLLGPGAYGIDRFLLTRQSAESFEILDVQFTSLGINRATCIPQATLMILKVRGLGPETHQFKEIQVDRDRIELSESYLHGREITNLVVNYTWRQGYRYHIVLSDFNGASAESLKLAPVIAASDKVFIQQKQLSGSTLHFTAYNEGICAAYLSRIQISGNNASYEIGYESAPRIVYRGHMLSLAFNLPFTPQLGANYTVNLTFQGTGILSLGVEALRRDGGGEPVNRSQ